MPVEVGGSDLAGLEVAPQPAAAIDLSIHETEPGLAAAVTVIGLIPAIHAGPLVIAQQHKDKGRRFLPLREAYWLFTRTSGEKKVCITGAQLGESDVFRQPIILTVEQTLRERRSNKTMGVGRSGRLAADGDVVRVAAKCRDVFVNPAQRGDQVEKSVVARGMDAGFRGQLRMREETKGPQPVIYGHHDDAFFCQTLPVVDRDST
jgi:hypothetical protein